MDFNPFQDSANFVDLLNSQQNVVFGSQGSVSLSSSQPPFVASQQKNDSSSKRRKFVDGSHSVSSQMNENDAAVDGDEGRPLGVKAAKRRGKKAVVEGKEREDFDHMWELKNEDLILKQSLSKMNLLSKLLARQGNLDDTEEVLKKKLIEALVSAGI
ncbi:hypothetical protein Bca52824_079236 [Brassica carinata]|uniref:Uncharacterized protein n=1 Tax=Brassica carinata TaxID=52824 RepID=A0A8X7PYX9_BRACI|nr:hypothetical protein Bca52824_079236 [Brassica carinata]